MDRYGEPPKGVLNLIDIALLRANARNACIKDIKQKGGEVFFTLTQLNFDAISQLCSGAEYKNRLLFVAAAKEPTLKLKLASGVDSLKQSKVFVENLRKLCKS